MCYNIGNAKRRAENMAEKTIPESKPVTIDNPEQASTNFFWKYLTETGEFNLQTTIRGILTFEQIQAHINSELAAVAYVVQLGGQAKQVGKQPEKPAEPLPQSLPSPITYSAPMPVEPEPIYVPTEEQKTDEELVFDAEELKCTTTNNKQYFHITGGRWKLYGVTVWDEVLVQAGIAPNTLEGGKTYALVGYKAYYIKKADGNPKKVVRLEKVA
jgi:hypothetical protein